jgi:hypothetical protein
LQGLLTGYIEAIKHNKETEVFKFLSLKTSPFFQRVIDEADTKRRGSPLYWAAAFGYIHFVGPLVEAGIEINKQDKLRIF